MCTIAITGFPDDTPKRELKNLCRVAEGFIYAHFVVGKFGRITLFVRFLTHDLAMKARMVLNGMEFDEDGGDGQTKLTAEAARRELELPPDVDAKVIALCLVAAASQQQPLLQQPPQRPSASSRGYQQPQQLPKQHQRPQSRGAAKPQAPAGRRGPAEAPKQQYEKERWGRQAWSEYSEDEEGDEGASTNEMYSRWTQQASSGASTNNQKVYNSSQSGGDSRATWSAPNKSYERERSPRLQKKSPIPYRNGSSRGRAESVSGDTLVCFSKKHQPDLIENFFKDCSGYVGSKFHDRIRSCFIKFEDADFAEEAFDRAIEYGLEVELARRSLEL